MAEAPSSLLLLRPCAGAEDGLELALTSSAAAGTSAAIRFLVSEERDAAWPVVHAVQRQLAERGFDVSVIATGAVGPNRKADQLARGVAAAMSTHRVVVVADSDAELTEACLSSLVAPILEGRAEAVWAPPVESPGCTWGDRLSGAVLDASLHAFVLLGSLDPHGMVGKTFAVDAPSLARAGGFEGVTEHLGEDVELGRRLRAMGARVEVGDHVVRAMVRGRTVRAVFERYKRWVTVVRAQRPWLLPSYPLLLAAGPLQLVAGLVAAGLDGALGLVALGGVLVARSLVTALVRRRAVSRSMSPSLLPWLADTLLLAAWVGALVSTTVQWRGVRLHVTRGGRVVQEAP